MKSLSVGSGNHRQTFTEAAEKGLLSIERTMGTQTEVAISRLGKLETLDCHNGLRSGDPVSASARGHRSERVWAILELVWINKKVKT